MEVLEIPMSIGAVQILITMIVILHQTFPVKYSLFQCLFVIVQAGIQHGHFQN